MKIYAFSGLGADHRIFEDLSLDFDLQVVPWLPFEKKDTMKSYALKMSSQMNIEEPYALLGVSFGGMLVSEIARELHPEKVVLISSASSVSELPKLYNSPFPVRLLPSICFNIPKWFSKKLFNPIHEDLLFEILADTDPIFVRNAVCLINKWDRREVLEKVFRIHGTVDAIIPCKIPMNLILEGGHFIVVDQAAVISVSINEYLKA